MVDMALVPAWLLESYGTKRGVWSSHWIKMDGAGVGDSVGFERRGRLWSSCFQDTVWFGAAAVLLDWLVLRFGLVAARYSACWHVLENPGREDINRRKEPRGVVAIGYIMGS
ncbi:hypothetical protein L6452_30004 [Arctium lappa]|uniref:Uncharacterized protein n=1 Tax=Arctium lappa TaxID=4217 RepID=A0ACB8ZIL9_ARCLA|nr:hypothetical protein L6452_30004 [Arctium lappa]